MSHINDMTKLAVLKEMEERQRLLDERKEIAREIERAEEERRHMKKNIASLNKRYKQYGTEIAKRPIADIAERHGIAFPTVQKAIRRWSPLKRIYGLK